MGCEIPELTHEQRMLGFEPDAQQQRVLESSSKRGALNCTRQRGRSPITAATAVQQAWGEKDSLTLVVSPGARQSSEFVRKAAGFARRLGISDEGGRRQRNIAGISERVADRGAAGTESNGARAEGGFYETWT